MQTIFLLKMYEIFNVYSLGVKVNIRISSSYGNTKILKVIYKHS